jgi:hypothetical protein|eukprot:COSAG06_NODE_263_length_18879_cov_71.911555_5_plen_74_part_00
MVADGELSGAGTGDGEEADASPPSPLDTTEDADDVEDRVFDSAAPAEAAELPALGELTAITSAESSFVLRRAM